MCLASLATPCDQLDRLTAGVGCIYSDHLGRNTRWTDTDPAPLTSGPLARTLTPGLTTRPAIGKTGPWHG